MITFSAILSAGQNPIAGQAQERGEEPQGEVMCCRKKKVWTKACHSSLTLQTDSMLPIPIALIFLRQAPRSTIIAVSGEISKNIRENHEDTCRREVGAWIEEK